MYTIPTRLFSRLASGTIKFQREVITRLKFVDFSRSAIRYYSDARKAGFEGHSFEKFETQFKLVSFKQGSQIKEIGYKEVVQIGDNFIAGELADSVFILNMSTFERWVLSTMKQSVLSNPRKLFPNSKKAIELNQLKTYESFDEFWEERVDEYLGGIPYIGMKEMLKTFFKLLAIKESQFSKDIVAKLNENSLCRNLVVHNNKIVNATYIRKAGKFARFKEGQEITVGEDLLFEQADNILRFMQDFRKIHESKDGVSGSGEI